MMRARANVLEELQGVSAAKHNFLKKMAESGKLKWNTRDTEIAPVVANFKNEVKEYYFVAQNRRCCYCSFELQSHKLTYDAEHILNKDEYPEYMFHLENIAVACKHCNIAKSNQSVSTSKKRFTEISSDTNDYSIVHPHMDDWGEHLIFDEIGRILAAKNSSKGVETIRICNIAAINLTRLSDNFSFKDKRFAEKALRDFHSFDSRAEKMVALELLTALARQHDHSGAQAILTHLSKEISVE